ncbi:uncharacterized protein VTP21DRAFT_7190 [Calcarisporiella thermophila]|uniref:uncharacterized protein n=1 Tax=Calcarisporiella thermophila TaxID=911321 RepID=UPI0037439372
MLAGRLGVPPARPGGDCLGGIGRRAPYKTRRRASCNDCGNKVCSAARFGQWQAAPPPVKYSEENKRKSGPKHGARQRAARLSWGDVAHGAARARPTAALGTKPLHGKKRRPRCTPV